jgi:von Willebrand factor type D domain
LTQEDVCQNAGTQDYVPKSIGDCSVMIDSVKSGNPYGAKCPLHNGESLGISHYVEYNGCNIEFGTKYENYAASKCLCPAGTCGLKSCGGSGSSVGGDLQFRTHDGTIYNFHGECDLVMAKSQSFGNGLGLDVHARTEMIAKTWTIVSNAAVRIGDDVFELNNNGTYYVNGIADAFLPTTLSSNNYKIHYQEEHYNDGENGIRSLYTIDLGNNDNLLISNYKKMISVNAIPKNIPDMVGMVGSYNIPGLVSRDGQTIIDINNANEMGFQWQVLDTEAILFTSIRSPQYPERCRLPDITLQNRHVRSVSQNMKDKAKVACYGVTEHLSEICINDVLTSGDVTFALMYNGGVL